MLEEKIEGSSFEARIAKAKEILDKLNAQNLSLKDGINLYKDGTKELEMAQKMLEDVRLEYQELKNQNSTDKEAE